MASAAGGFNGREVSASHTSHSDELGDGCSPPRLRPYCLPFSILEPKDSGLHLMNSLSSRSSLYLTPFTQFVGLILSTEPSASQGFANAMKVSPDLICLG